MHAIDRYLRWLPPILMMAVIFAFSSIPSTEMPNFGFWDLLVKKGGHATGYGLLALCIWFALKWDRRWLWLAFFLTVLYAGTDEFHQSFVPGRHSSLVDIGIDSIGALIALWIAFFVRRRKEPLAPPTG
jgi:VanZ family protein